jgi:ABC-type transport system involved in Fe-S cluster assembly fused permease/ATPase subunit
MRRPRSSTATSLAFLNAGQAAIIAVGLVAVMGMAAQGVLDGRADGGRFRHGQRLHVIQLTMPLGFLGTVYREIRQSLVDMREMFDLLDQPARSPTSPARRRSRSAARSRSTRCGLPTTPTGRS